MGNIRTRCITAILAKKLIQFIAFNWNKDGLRRKDVAINGTPGAAGHQDAAVCSYDVRSNGIDRPTANPERTKRNNQDRDESIGRILESEFHERYKARSTNIGFQLKTFSRSDSIIYFLYIGTSGN